MRDLGSNHPNYKEDFLTRKMLVGAYTSIGPKVAPPYTKWGCKEDLGLSLSKNRIIQCKKEKKKKG